MIIYECCDLTKKYIKCKVYKVFSMQLLQYWHHWEPGDFLISDNLALGHEASPQTQWSRERVGLRVMHRVTIAGKHKPRKQK